MMHPTTLASLSHANLSLPATLVAGLLASALIALPAAADDSLAEAPPGGHYHVQAPFNVDHGHTQHHASTFAEGLNRGRAAYVQSLGVYKLNSAQANILNEQACVCHIQVTLAEHTR